MLSLIGSIIGFAGSVVPGVLDHYKKKEDNKIKLEVMKMQADLMREKADIDLIKFHAMAEDNEHQRLINHDIAIAKGPLAWLRSSVRPTITYMFFALFAAVKIAALNEAMYPSNVIDANGNPVKPVPFATAIETVWDEETQAIFAAIISFWFGSRAIEVSRKRVGG